MWAKASPGDLRGGSWYSAADPLAAAQREVVWPDYAKMVAGSRCVADAPR